ncbi:hypothetical protein DLREEDagrD3_01110 [Denitratisoma sp. agr-D3]
MAVFCLLTLATAAEAGPAAPVIQEFTPQTWEQLLRTLPRPAAVVFSTTDCTHCPAIIDSLAQAIRHQPRPRRPMLAVVMMDELRPADIDHLPHLRKADKLYVFAGNEMAIRYAVQPEWRGMTPFTALLPAMGTPRFQLGALPPADLAAFLQGR